MTAGHDKPTWAQDRQTDSPPADSRQAGQMTRKDKTLVLRLTGCATGVRLRLNKRVAGGLGDAMSAFRPLRSAFGGITYIGNVVHDFRL